ncbi:retrieval of early ER protein Rer1 [Auriculariales sp. MPI-PUGE-AT-0066]|nr:retrieval of early ER protein Rer1 [Auriculariales sp. MPI-PUGE-AT-0066]
MMNAEPAGGAGLSVGGLWTQVQAHARRYQAMIDSTAPLMRERWMGTAFLVAVFVLRIVLAQGWYIICYAHAIYVLNLLLAFLSPKFDPSLEADLAADDMEEGGTTPEVDRDRLGLGGNKDDEFRPFIRRLPEWQFWLSTTRASALALFCSFFGAFDVPVYWPILVIYFFILFTLTMRRQIQHMIKYRYVPWDFGKVKYGGAKK